MNNDKRSSLARYRAALMYYNNKVLVMYWFTVKTSLKIGKNKDDSLKSLNDLPKSLNDLDKNKNDCGHFKDDYLKNKDDF